VRVSDSNSGRAAGAVINSNRGKEGRDALGRLIEAHKTAYARWLSHIEFRKRLESESPRHQSVLEQIQRDEDAANILEEVALIKLLEHPPKTIQQARRKAIYLAKETRLRKEMTSKYALALLRSFVEDRDT
jgi:hypothetical protein